METPIYGNLDEFAKKVQSYSDFATRLCKHSQSFSVEVSSGINYSEGPRVLYGMHIDAKSEMIIGIKSSENVFAIYHDSTPRSHDRDVKPFNLEEETESFVADVAKAIQKTGMRTKVNELEIALELVPELAPVTSNQ